MAEQYSWLDASGKGYSAGQHGGEAGKLMEWSRNTVADGRWLNRETIKPFSGRDQYLLASLNQTYNECSAFSGDLQYQINVIEARADVVDVVGSYSAFVDKYSANFDPTSVSDQDVVKILNDETSANAQTYYRWLSADNPSGTWTGVGSLEPSYSNANISDGILTVNNTNTERNYTLSGEKYIELNGNDKTGAFGLTDEFISSASQCYTALTSHSASWNKTSATLCDNSGKWEQAYDWSKDSSANLISVSSTFVAYSGKWNDTSATLFNNSSKWEQSYTALTNTSGGWNKTSAWVYNNSANIVDASATLYNNSANWQATYSAVSSNSAIWSETAYVPLSAIECKIGSANSANKISFAQGSANSANEISFAQGKESRAETISFAQGLSSIAQQYSFAQGLSNSSTMGSFTQGISNIANNHSIAQGVNSTASNYSQAFGYGAVITNTGMAIGSYNKTSANVAFVIGDGTDNTNRSDLYWIDHNGNVSAKGNITAANFYINGTPLSDNFIPLNQVFSATGSNFNKTFNYVGFKLSAGDGVGFVKNDNTLAISAQAGIPEGTFRINAMSSVYGAATLDIDYMEIKGIKAWASISADDCSLYVSGVDNGIPVTAKYSMWDFYENSTEIDRHTFDITQAAMYVPALCFGYGQDPFVGLRQCYFKLDNYVHAGNNQKLTMISADNLTLESMEPGIIYLV